MELMSSLFFCALIALLPQALVLLLPSVYSEHTSIEEAWQEVKQFIDVGQPNNTDHELFKPDPDADHFLLFTSYNFVSLLETGFSHSDSCRRSRAYSTTLLQCPGVSGQPSLESSQVTRKKNLLLGQVLGYNNETSVTSSNFDPNVPTVVVVHGWFENNHSPINLRLRGALLRQSDVNVIIMDWSRFSFKNYVTATTAVPSIGRGLGQFLAFLNNVTGMPYDSVHLVGFSLGGHVVGNAGRELDGQIARITALDPAGPLWFTNGKRLRNTDAIYVEVIHTDAGVFGIDKVVGDADFFPNGGSTQPGCRDTTICNHERAWQLYASTIKNRHLVGHECTSAVQFFMDFCRGRRYVMGNTDLNKFGTGVYRLSTLSTYPY